ncbi:MAG: zinc ribbon domain-containing protein [Thermodesulfovibrionales bacterium]|nr:zinc ribbon domain-containing protein [Thermodesulfovibrionales bacterium]
MPVYEYECKDCRQRLEIIQRFDDPPLETCESCGGRMQKLISNTSFVLKGNGWYVTDYVRNANNKEDKSNGKKQETQTTETKVEASTSESKQTGVETTTVEAKKT